MRAPGTRYYREPTLARHRVEVRGRSVPCCRCKTARRGLGMAQVAPDGVLSLQCWLNKAAEWGQKTTLESQQDVCLHLPQLQDFLLQIYESLKHMRTHSAMERFPGIGQLLGRLCWNPFVVAHEGNRSALMSCLCCLYNSDPCSPLELKANSWIQDSICHLFTASGPGHQEVWKAVNQLGCSTVDYHGKLLKNTIISLVSKLKGCHSLDGNSNNRLSPQDVREISIKCIPIQTMPDVYPLVEALLMYHSSEPEEVLDELFIETVNRSVMRKKIVLSESAVLSLWLRHLPSLEKAVLDLFQRLIAVQSKSMSEMEHIIKDSFLPQASCHPSIFMIVDGILRKALLETDGNLKVTTIIRLFTRRFIQVYEKDNVQARYPLRAFFPHNSLAMVMALLRESQGLKPNISLQHLHGIIQKLREVDCDERSHKNLFNSWYLLIHFGDWVDVAAEQLLMSKTEISEDLLWLLAFYYNPCNDNQERIKTMDAAREVHDRMAMIRRNAVVCAVTLRGVFEEKKECNFGTTQLLRHLLVTFLLYSSEWHRVARDCISQL
uniref:FA complementation group C n=1 Tax=Leptobrachium leishanense TaxID=445787 RepID=A0A8C5LPT6_9ANUR